MTNGYTGFVTHIIALTFFPETLTLLFVFMYSFLGQYGMMLLSYFVLLFVCSFVAIPTTLHCVSPSYLLRLAGKFL